MNLCNGKSCLIQIKQDLKTFDRTNEKNGVKRKEQPIRKTIERFGDASNECYCITDTRDVCDRLFSFVWPTAFHHFVLIFLKLFL